MVERLLLASLCKDLTSSPSEQNQRSLPVWHGLSLPLSWHPDADQTEGRDGHLREAEGPRLLDTLATVNPTHKRLSAISL